MAELLYGLIGKKLGHSFSAKYFNKKFEREEIDAEYKLFEIPSIEGISNLISEHPNLRGLNVTIPYKEEVLPYLHSMTDTATEIGAVNSIRIERTDNERFELFGHNTDAIGFWEAIEGMIDKRGRALVLGQGGASKAVIYSLERHGIEVTKVSRKKLVDTITYSELTRAIMESNDIIVNCTPLGMWPDINAKPEIPYDMVDDRYLCFDLIYNPEETVFMRECRRRGATVSNGLQMLYNQAEAAYKFWNE